MERSSGAAPPSKNGGSGQQESAPLAVRIEDTGAATVVALAGELDLSTLQRMESPLLEQVRQRPAVVVDLTKLSFIDSSGIGILIKAFRESNGVPIHLVVDQGSQVERVFQIAGVAHAMPVFSDRKRAMTAVSRNPGDPDGAAGN